MESKQRKKESFLATMMAGAVFHIFAITNVLHNYDTVTQVPCGAGTTIASGRWFLDVLSRWFNKLLFGVDESVNVPFFNIIFSIVVLSLASMLIVEILDIKNRKFVWLASIIFIVFPTAASNLMFHFTCQYYSIAIFLSVYAVWINSKYTRWGWICSIVCLVLSLGIYQAFYPVAVSVSLIVFIKKIISSEEYKRIIFEGVKSVAVLVSGLIGYLVYTKVDMRIRHYGLGDYKGINEMGKISIGEIPRRIYQCYYNIGLIFRNNYYGINETQAIKNALLVLGIISFIMLITIIVVRKKVLPAIIAMAAVAILPIALDFVGVMCPTGIYTLMVYGSVGIYYVPIVLFEEFSKIEMQKIRGCIEKVKKSIKYILVICLLYVSINYIWLANGNYLVMHYTQAQTVLYFEQLYTRIRATEGYSLDKAYAFIGEPSDPAFANVWSQSYVPFNSGGTSKYMLGSYSQYMMAYLYTGVAPTSQASQEKIEELQQLEVVQNMPIYPNDGSILVIDDVIVVKFNN